MKKAIFHWTGEKPLSIEESFKLYSAAGFVGVELNIGEKERPLHLGSKNDELSHLKKLAHANGLEIHSLMGSLLWKYPLTSPDTKIAEKGKQILEKGLDFAHKLGASALLVVPGLVTEELSYDEAYQRALGAVKELAPRAESLQVNLAVENVWNKFLLSPLEMRDFIDAIGSDYVGAYFDVGNVVINGYPQQWIRILGERIRRIHLKDYKVGVDFTYLLEGDVNWPEVMTALREVGYDGYLTAELPSYKCYPEEMVWQTSRAMDRILGSSLKK